MSGTRPLFFIALGLFGLYVVEFGVVGILPAVVQRYGVGVAQAGGLVALFATVVAVCGPAMVLWLSRLDRRKVLAACLLVFSLCSLLSAWAPSFGALMALRVPSALLHPVFFSVAFAAAVSLYPPQRAAHATSMAFLGTTLGLVLGVPLATWIEATLSYEASFYFCATVSLMAAVGVWSMLPPRHQARPHAPGTVLAVLRRPAVWLSVAATVCVFAAMFSVYSYAAEYLARQAHLGGEAIGLLLGVFGVGGVLGNLLAGRALGHRLAATVLLYPVVLAAAYGVLLTYASASLAIMLPLCLLWGAAHTSGLIVSQLWMTSAAPDAPEFVTSLFVSAANLGVVLGAAVGGGFMDAFGMQGTVWSGWLFAALAAFAVLARRPWRIRQP
ncbi:MULTISPECIES: MFS transporter [Pseudoxanthomonas]|uniref:DHA1 family inner membrane transport protein n=1 Tax=Pseudoxanthomonas winnipegensis TaxID=2480810 RepID=A0AAW8GCV3_9GAMM|nr:MULTISPECIES: MFS transporter [Pseudoxanthomonas]MDQ1119070.1 DHA1 family inner membrane transport protein [Pseudoxanthomonas winnipegensis]MDQ1132260.1 DHA1 family inner membrane transport protein [Pseudoxanthomonas winnipegensis]MDR6137727.1 DHA1 family inner membrane transport protein [Pseudoxanthomonas sp. SORGH_AS_0997]